MSNLSHIDSQGNARMVDVSAKDVTSRAATAEAIVRLGSEAYTALRQGTVKKGDVLAVARVAGIMGGKRTSDLIPLCHPLPIAAINIDFELDDSQHTVRVIASAVVSARTGIEMETLTAASIAALTIYDMCKALDKSITIEQIRLLQKHGGGKKKG